MKYAKERRKAKRVIRKWNEAHWEVGAVLVPISDELMYREWGFGTWREYVEKEAGIAERMSQLLMQMWQWFNKMPPEAQAWARSERWSCIRFAHTLITPRNWKKWRTIIGKRTQAELQSYLRANDDLMVQRAKREGARLHLKNVSPEAVVKLRCEGLSAAKIALQTGMTIEEIRLIAPFIKTFVPRDVYERIVRMALDNNHSVAEEVSWVLSEMYSEDSIREVS